MHCLAPKAGKHATIGAVVVTSYHDTSVLLGR